MDRLGLVVLFVAASIAVTDVLAQSQNMYINVSVIGGLTIDASVPMDFGTVTPMTPEKRIYPTDANAGHVLILGPPNSNIHWDIVAPTSLEDGTSLVKIGNWIITGDQDASNKASAPTKSMSTNVSLSNTGEYHLWFGATINPDKILTKVQGIHSGFLTIQVSYQ